ncbi:CDK5 and ABL1 enzyme substrate 1 isoform X2 [Rhinatrema bivittatum]|uniref:CDK5 and ABL1 enzyme substrate 1 isoform X2 n=1 Tax=Rhinatrema bivittatum TaxID=194408 RepID=UPI00112A9261|nr:CDK5 and ABL1 enzyme substrate 1 isoform X2 [Rhinatrema bivittatum]
MAAAAAASSQVVGGRGRDVAALAKPPGGGCSSSSPEPPQPRRRMDPRRRQAALSFLTNISLDGRPPQDEEGGGGAAAAGKAHPTPAPASPRGPSAESPRAAPVGDQPREEREEEEDAFAPCLQVAGAAGSRGRLNSFTPGMTPRQAGLGYCCPEPGSQSIAALELQRCRRRLISQRSSLETLEDIEENAPLRRCRTLSGSPRPKNFKKIHFIKNMRQHDTRNGRIVLISGRRAFCSIFSVLPYRDCSHIGDMKLEGGRQRHSSGGVGTKEMIIGLEGVELGADGKTVSYTQFMYPTNALGARRNTIDSTISFSQFRNTSHRSLILARANSIQGSIDTGSDMGDYAEYDPNLLDDPQWPCGKHKRVLIFPSYMVALPEPGFGALLFMNGDEVWTFLHFVRGLSRQKSRRLSLLRHADSGEKVSQGPETSVSILCCEGPEQLILFSTAITRHSCTGNP